MKIAIAQINPTIGDLAHNSQKILDFTSRAKKLGAELIIFPELSLPGYPPKDLLVRRDFLADQIAALGRISRECKISAIVGAAILEETNKAPFNAAVLCQNGQWHVVAKKLLLPNYNVFDEKRYFRTPSDHACQVLDFFDKKLLISICEDAWSNEVIEGQEKYNFDPIDNAVRAIGPVDAIINITSSPYSMSKPMTRKGIFTTLAKTHRTTVLVAGQVGANDQLLFDGQSMVIDQTGEITGYATPCQEDLVLHQLGAPINNPGSLDLMDGYDLLLEALAMGIRDYVEKCQSGGVIVGVSGGIDSAVCLALAVRALGQKRVRAIFLPSQFTSAQSESDAELLTKNLSLTLEVLAIEDAVNQLRSLFLKQQAHASAYEADIFDQNLQSRVRGLLIMGLTNLCNYLMLTTSNKSELAVGYSTIYGDMCGAFSPIGDLYKTQVWKLAHTINKHQEIIPNSIINRPPTAELKHNQLDTDSLPDFTVLDEILFNFIELEKSASEIETITKLPRSLIDEIIKKISIAEYKRRQAPFPLMVSDKVFGDARRLPIAKRMSV
ncbi:MAG TPA: NAD+ synthase [Myxococcota bacterium]|nr:NAD+ synthase [Myxococcota bacterium]